MANPYDRKALCSECLKTLITTDAPPGTPVYCWSCADKLEKIRQIASEPMSDNLREYLEKSVRLKQLTYEGMDDSDEADEIIAQMDRPWWLLTEEEKRKARQASYLTHHDIRKIILTRKVKETVEVVNIGVTTDLVYNPYRPNGCSTRADLEADVAAGKPVVFGMIGIGCKVIPKEELK